MSANSVILIGVTHEFQRPAICSTVPEKRLQAFAEYLRRLVREEGASAIFEEMTHEGLWKPAADHVVALEALAEMLGPELDDVLAASLEREREVLGRKDELRSTPLIVATELGVKHDYSDLDETDRSARGVGRGELGFHDRERHWLARVEAEGIFPLVFICGAGHVATFTIRLQQAGFHVDDRTSAEWFFEDRSAGDDIPTGPPTLREQIENLERQRHCLIESHTCHSGGSPYHGKIEEPEIRREIACLESTIAILLGLEAEERRQSGTTDAPHPHG